jgi:sodium transport system ATP-binding protein
VILSTHIMSEVERLCDDVAILHRGRILLQGPVAEVKERTGISSIEDLFFSMVREA